MHPALENCIQISVHCLYSCSMNVVVPQVSMIISMSPNTSKIRPTRPFRRASNGRHFQLPAANLIRMPCRREICLHREINTPVVLETDIHSWADIKWLLTFLKWLSLHKLYYLVTNEEIMWMFWSYQVHCSNLVLGFVTLLSKPMSNFVPKTYLTVYVKYRFEKFQLGTTT